MSLRIYGSVYCTFEKKANKVITGFFQKQLEEKSKSRITGILKNNGFLYRFGVIVLSLSKKLSKGKAQKTGPKYAVYR